MPFDDFLLDPGLRGMIFFGASRLQNYRLKHPERFFFVRLDIFPDATNLEIILTVFVPALPAPRALWEPHIAQT